MLTLLAMLLASSPASIGAPDECQYDLPSYVGMNPIEFDQGKTAGDILQATKDASAKPPNLFKNMFSIMKTQLDERYTLFSGGIEGSFWPFREIMPKPFRR
jgi:hypothetical protein